jgi:transcriptional regulator with XRE-family HTH domain
MVGKEVRRRREELGLTGAQLAVRAGMAPSTVSQIETGKRSPSSISVVKLADALGVEVGDLFPLVQASFAFEDLADEENRQLQLQDERRTQDILLQYPSEEERNELLEKNVGFHAYYNELARNLIAAAKEKDMDVNGTATILGFFFGKGLQDALEENGVIAYVNSVLQGKVEATPRERESCRSFSMRISAEIAEAARLVEEARDLARQRHSAAHEAELGIPDIEAYLANVSSKK